MNYTNEQKETFAHIFEERIKSYRKVTDKWLKETAKALEVGSYEPSGLFEARRAFYMVRHFTMALKALNKGDNEMAALVKHMHEQIMRHASWGSRSTDPYAELETRHALEGMNAVLDILGEL
jgi:hypothetical protein